jgi:hypothetical protein
MDERRVASGQLQAVLRGVQRGRRNLGRASPRVQELDDLLPLSRSRQITEPDVPHAPSLLTSRSFPVSTHTIGKPPAVRQNERC